MEFSNLAKIQRDFFNKGHTKEYRFRLGALNTLKGMIKDNEEKIMEALKKDFGKSRFETYETEIGTVYAEIEYQMKNLKNNMKPRVKLTSLASFPSYGKIHPEPFGSVLIISPWNYPFYLAMTPLVGAIAAGNTAVIKPSSEVPITSQLMADMVRDTFEPDYIAVINGSNADTHVLLEQKFDYIFYTGSPNFGKTVMRKASENLIPVTLELGGKSPCIIDKDADLKQTAKRIAWGKFINAGQTCVAPDYVLAHSAVKDEFIDYLKKQITRMYGENPLLSEDLPNIVSERAFIRLTGALEGQNVIFGGQSSKEKQKIAPTLVENPTLGSHLETEEIFGPILPILSFNKLEGAIKYIHTKEKPLALYYFGHDKQKKQKIIDEIPYGGGCFNETVMHLSTSSLPFGGVGNSGMGSYHGVKSFETFSHYKSMLYKLSKIDFEQKFPPYDEKKLNFIKRFL